jgi:hypothetical protein
MFAEAFHLMIKDIHLALEVKNFFRQLYAYDGLQYEIQYLEA